MSNVMRATLGIVVLFCLVSGCNRDPVHDFKTVSIPSDYVAYMDPNGVYSLKIPPGWTTENNPHGVAFICPTKAPDELRKNVNIIAQDAPENVTMTAAIRGQKKELESHFPGYQLIKSENATLPNHDAHLIVFSGNMNNHPLKMMQLMLLDHNRIYFITFTSDPASYETYWPKVEPMLASFHGLK